MRCCRSVPSTWSTEQRVNDVVHTETVAYSIGNFFLYLK
jgi:hypothetical protein